MNIDLTRLKMGHWFEDEDGNVYTGLSENLPKDKKYFTYHHIDPLTYTESVDSYTCHPEYEHENNSFYQAMLNFKWFRKLMLKKYSNNKTFKPLLKSNTTYYAMQDVIIAMVNSGDYALDEAIYICATACERCSNVLAYKYLNGADGYPEFSGQWYRCNTVCDFCQNLEVPQKPL